MAKQILVTIKSFANTYQSPYSVNWPFSWPVKITQVGMYTYENAIITVTNLNITIKIRPKYINL